MILNIPFAIFQGVPELFGIRIEFVLFALTLVGVAVFHNKTMIVALTGLSVILLTKIVFDPEFSLVHHLFGGNGYEGEWRTLLNLLGLLFGFSILAKHFEKSDIPKHLPKILPNNWLSGVVLLFFIMFISTFLDNIAAAMIGGTIALVIYNGKVHVGFLAAIVAASNAGGAGSVVGDTTTTLMWIDGVNPAWVLHAFVASLSAFFVFAFIGSYQQHRYQAIIKPDAHQGKVDHKRIIVVFLILILAIFANYAFEFPALGVWVAILLGAIFVETPWKELGKALKGTVFLLSLVTCASLMPVDTLPPASWHSAFILGFVSSVFDNIPLTKLCLEQGGYDWGILAYTVGFGGSMIWFGSSAGVALSNLFPETRSVVDYVRKGWHVTASYLIGFIIVMMVIGWHPHPAHKKYAVKSTSTTEIKANE